MMSNFTNSGLATIRNTNHSKINGSGNYTRKITKITIHHAAGVISGAALQAWGHNPKCSASWQYGIGNDGVIGLMTDEKNRAWTSSSPSNDYQAVTIEVSNSATGGNWPVGDKAYNALLDLCTDICKRNGIAKLTFDGTPNGSLTHHSMFAATSCPGKFLLDRFPQICAEVNKRLGQRDAAPNSPTAGVSTTPSIDFKVGDIVQFTGGGVYTSSTSVTPAHTRGQSWCKVTQTAMKARNQYHLISEDGGKVYGWVVSETVKVIGASSVASPASAFQPYTVKVTANVLNIRKGAGTNYAVVGSIKNKGIYTIVEEKSGWGRLKSGAGWISLEFVQRR